MILKGRVTRGNFSCNLQSNDVLEKKNIAGCSGMSNVRKLFSTSCNNLQHRSTIKQIETFKIAVLTGEKKKQRNLNVSGIYFMVVHI